MKKTLLLSVVASTMIMAGGSIAPVEPVVEAPAVAVAASDWDFSGQAVVYYQTDDSMDTIPVNTKAGSGDLFNQRSSVAAAGIQLGAVNKNLIGGIGAGFELSGISSLGLENDVVSALAQSATGDLTGAAITQAYLTYGVANTSVKIGRQQLPKSLSPLAFTEGWNVFKNTFEAALLVNTDITDTVVALAYVTRANNSVGSALSEFSDIHSALDNTYFAAVSTKAIPGVTLTGSWYQLNNIADLGDATAIWGDAQFKVAGISIGLQGGQIDPTDVAATLTKTTAFGAKVAGTVGMFNLSAAYSSVDDGSVKVANLAGTGIKTPLYTQMILNQEHIKTDADTIVLKASAKALGGTFGIAYDITTDNATDNSDYTELDISYKTKLSDNTTLFAAYVMSDDETYVEAQNFVRVWARYSF